MTMKPVKNNVSLNVMYSGHLNTAMSSTEKRDRKEGIFLLIRISIIKLIKLIMRLLYFNLIHIKKLYVT